MSLYKQITAQIKATISPMQRRHLRAIYNNIVHHRSKVNSNYELTVIDTSDSFFGYYDLVPIQNNSIIYIKPINNHQSDIILHDLKFNSKRIIATTNIWNWQQGCRLRWSSDHVSIYYNDFIDGKLVSVKQSINNGIRKEFDTPFYDINNQETMAATLDFVRLGNKRPGYGYVLGEYNQPSIDELERNGIFLYSLLEQKCIDQISYKDISCAMLDDNQQNDLNSYYINHLSFSPSGRYLLFFWIRILSNGIHHASLCVFDTVIRKIIVLEKELSVSHYTWKNDNEILITAYDNERKCRYYIYNIETQIRSPFMHSVLQEDGHPTYYNDECLITDTYPDKMGYEHIYKVDIAKAQKLELLSIYHSYKVTGEMRCDLHPRISKENDCLCFDCNISGKRQIMLMKGF